jgi:hypothetical protein
VAADAAAVLTDMDNAIDAHEKILAVKNGRLDQLTSASSLPPTPSSSGVGSQASSTASSPHPTLSASMSGPSGFGSKAAIPPKSVVALPAHNPLDLGEPVDMSAYRSSHPPAQPFKWTRPTPTQSTRGGMQGRFSSGGSQPHSSSASSSQAGSSSSMGQPGPPGLQARPVVRGCKLRDAQVREAPILN